MKLELECGYGNENIKTAVKNNEFGELDIKTAASRLVARKYGAGYFAHRAAGWDDLPMEFAAEVCRPLGGLTEHVGKINFVLTN